ncbi:HAD family hydrolase [Rhodoferax saidenbachensis]|uniref:HAD family hydrolase n=1 Tax=Rhodoferax saidenbachensis TaxID=1484693 RepID=A0A1P8K6N4_9BURK|nr:HAD family phosphatase [Rhodoferax saidenbachensis]APW41669.1 HAD family hydrolase [Rhodoferax saidenbachensis]
MKFDAVLFDCDGVLVDSEPITNGVLRDMLQDLGWTLTLQECMDVFVGKAVKDEIAQIEARTGKPLPPEWMAEFRTRRNAALMERAQPIPNVLPAVQQIHAAYGGRIACASGADLPKVLMQMGKTQLLPFFEGFVFSGHDLPRSKPFPDVYLAAAAALGVDAARCAVVEDTVTGIAAGVAAGATVFGYAPQGQRDVLLAAGASQVFADMTELPGLLV